MQNWDSLQPANYEHNWYSNMFHQTIKQEPQSQPTNQLEHYLSMKQQELTSAMTPSPRAADSNINTSMTADVNTQQHYFDSSTSMFQQHHPLGFNPLTPPGLPNAVLPSMAHFYPTPQNNGAPTESMTAKLEQQTNANSSNNNALTPRNTPPMDVTPPKSPKLSIMSTSSEMDQDMMSSNSSEDMKFLESEDDESIRMPIYNSHGKMKNYKCKTCGFLAITKVAFWEHARSHMKPEKTLQCSKCPFVTELKHHLEYHIRKHKNLKPFQCDKCNYSCVNKSMLNSHRKSHSSVYQYRCADCDYATKYCHSFKLHLRKYDHKPGMVLDEDGSPNPSVVIDVYGTRRGPKMKSGRKESSAKMPQLSAALQGFALNQQQNQHHSMPASPAKSTTSSSSEMLGNGQPTQASQQPQSTSNKQEQLDQHQQQQLSNLLPPQLSALLQQQRNLPFFPYWNLNLQMLAAQQQAAVLAQLSPRLRETALQNLQTKHEADDDKDASFNNDDEEEWEQSCEGSAMDLSAATPTKNAQVAQEMIMNLKMREEGQHETPLISSSNQNRRKGRVLRLDQTLQSKAFSMSPEEKSRLSPPVSEVPTSSSLDDSAKEADGSQSTEEPSSPATNSISNTTPATTTASPPSGTIFECKYCDIYFRDAVLYTIHMGYHSCDDVFKCNMCGEKCDGPVGLFVHMARNAHS